MLRIGFSYDCHKIVLNRKMYLGGILLDTKYGLLGHSDADVVLHAIANALLGSLALGDLGTHFPDNSEKTLNMDSKIILKECYQMVKNEGYRLNNLDLMIHSEHVMINPIVDKMRESISSILGVDKKYISIKATRGEGMGFIGRGEGISCECALLVTND
jgi:2-C-methyl-D-erythritol 2,4-cyclodiphosphate synthase